MKRFHHHRPSGIILLVVLSMLTFFSLLVAAYLVFSSQAQQASFAIATRNIKQPDPNAMIDEALMTLVRGTADKTSPFWGEDMLSDLYGRTDYLSLQVETGTTPTKVNGFIRLSMEADPDDLDDVAIYNGGAELRDDIYTGRTITFTSGGHVNQSYRVLRSIATAVDEHDLVIEEVPFFDVIPVVAGDKFRMNGLPRSSPGFGFDGTNIGVDAQPQPNPDGGGANVVLALPAVLQPSHLGNAVQKYLVIQPGSDFDEGYDAADYNNWFLSFRHPDGTVIPSFHRPSVANYILNQNPDYSSIIDFKDLVANLVRATLRPIPIAQNQFGTHDAIHAQFTGGNTNFALRTPILINSKNRLNQFAKVLTGDVVAPDLAWDVDNDSDGVNDSVWIDLDLPIFTSPEGKLLKPLVAVMIEDLGGRLNVNAHGNYALVASSDGLTDTSGTGWAGAPGTPGLFRGLGYGPAEINIPQPSSNALSDLLAARYQSDGSTDLAPGVATADALTTLMNGWMPGALTGDVAYGQSIDPYGRGATGISANGNLVTVVAGTPLADDAGTTVTEPSTFESQDNPYEFDPTGHLSGDSAFSVHEMEALLRLNDSDSSPLPLRLKTLLTDFIAADPDFGKTVTTISKSDDSPSTLSITGASSYQVLVDAIGATLTDAQLRELIAPEIRLARKLNVNRPFGNGVDDSAPLNGVIDEPGDIAVETEAFQSIIGSTIDANFLGHVPDYDLDAVAIDGRQLLARHLYVLMMTISDDLNSDNFPSYGDTLGTPMPVSDRDRYRARRLAQWAVNVVDYRDSDSINTPFEYDEDISDGWDVDGDLATIETNRGLVWGVENPELLFTESIAFHDVRVRDTNLDVTTKVKGISGSDDEDTDQMRIPQGSLILELYCPRRRVSVDNTDTANAPYVAGIPREIYDVNTGVNPVTYGIDLDRTVTTLYSAPSTYGSGTSYEVPVWRVAISEPHFGVTLPNNSPIDLRSTKPDTLSFEPAELDELDLGISSLTLQRFAVFTSYPDIAALQTAIEPIPDITEQARVFFDYHDVSTNLLPEQYLSLTPRTTTVLGSNVHTIGTGPTKSDQQFAIDTTAGSTGLIHDNLIGTTLTPNTTTAIQPGLAMVMAGFAPAAWATAPPEGVGMNVSEPVASNAAIYYAEPTQRYRTDITDYPLTDAYAELDSGGLVVGLDKPKDQPEDMRLTSPISELSRWFGGTPLSNTPEVADPMLGTVENYRTAFLQRIADPTLGFDPVLNPYITVDQIAIDLTIFSGEEMAAQITLQGEAPSVQTIEESYVRGTRQRDGIGINGVGANILHSYSTAAHTTVVLDGDRTSYFALDDGAATVGDEMTTSLNYLNTGFGAPLGAPNLGRPPTPFVMHPWLNRPFASPLELLLVPACSQGRLFEECSVSIGDPAIYPDGTAPSSPPSVAYSTVMLGPYRHLLNFFHSDEAEVASEFCQLFDYVSTAPRFRGDLRAINPARLVGTDLPSLYPAPFNFLDDGQRLGRISLNTLSDFSVWKGLMQGHLNPNEYGVGDEAGAVNEDQLSFDAFNLNRRGYAVPSGVQVNVTASNATTPVNYAPDHFNPLYPTQFAGVFKRSSDSRYAPLVKDDTGTMEDESEVLRRNSVNATLLRGEGGLLIQEPIITGGLPTTTAMMVRSSTELPVTAHMNRGTNPFMRYQTLMRMPNLVSDNSQVFLIRMTMGFFEIDASNTDNLGAEYNEETGRNQRYQAMFIMDRSVPVGFMPGQDLNARDTIIFERYFQ